MTEFTKAQIDKINSLSYDLGQVYDEAQAIIDGEEVSDSEDDVLEKYNNLAASAREFLEELQDKMRKFYETAPDEFKDEHGLIFEDWMEEVVESGPGDAMDLDEIEDGESLANLATDIEEVG